MKNLQLMGLIAAAMLVGACASNESATEVGRTGEREQANRRQAQQQLGQTSEEQQNLKDAQQALVNRDGNPNRARNF